MKQQDFREIEPKIAKYGCYFLCLCKIAERYLQKELRVQDAVEIYLKSVNEGYLYENCYVLKPQMILNLIFKMFNYKKKCVYSNIFIHNDTTNGFTDIIAKVKVDKITTTHFILIGKDKKIIYDPDSFVEREAKKRGGYSFLSFRGFEIK